MRKEYEFKVEDRVYFLRRPVIIKEIKDNEVLITWINDSLRWVPTKDIRTPQDNFMDGLKLQTIF